MILGILAGLGALILAIMWLARDDPPRVVSSPGPQTGGSIVNFDKSLSLFHGSVTGQITTAMSLGAAAVGLIMLALLWMHWKNNRRTQRLGRALVSLDGAPGGQGGGAQAPGWVGPLLQMQQRMQGTGQAGGFSLPLPDLLPRQQQGTTVAPGPRAAQYRTIEDGLKKLRHAAWTIFPEDAGTTPPRRVVCERGIQQLTTEELRVFPLGLPLHATIIIMDILSIIITFRHHLYPQESPA